jgi:hypothetical protein
LKDVIAKAKAAGYKINKNTIGDVTDGRRATSEHLQGICAGLGVTIPTDERLWEWLDIGIAILTTVHDGPAIVARLRKIVEGDVARRELGIETIPEASASSEPFPPLQTRQ